MPDEQKPRPREEIPAGDLAGIASWMQRQRATETTPGDHVFTPPSVEEMAEDFDGFSGFVFVGAGGMGAVYRATQDKLGREVAIKILSPAKRRDSGFRERFAREALSMAQLNHPNIVSIYETGERGDLFYIMMEYVPGVPLRTAIADGDISETRAIEITRQLCEALTHSHGKAVLHRDIKPGNILLRDDGEALLTDFGLAKILDETKGDFTLTLTDAAFGTPVYMAPEQCQSMRDVDGRADIYSLGVVLYEMLTGELPVGRFDPPTRHAAAVMKALENKADDRFPTAAAFSQGLSAREPRKMLWWAITVAACGLVLLALFVILKKPQTPENTLGMQFVPLPGTNVSISKWETRVSDFAAFVAATDHDTGTDMFSFDTSQPTLPLTQNGASWRTPGFEQGDNHPVVGVSWNDAVAFCAWLTEHEHAAGRLEDDEFYRLPTDREWSIASGLNELLSSEDEGINLALADFLPWDESSPPPPGSGNFADASTTKLFPRLPVLSRYDDGHAATAPVGSANPDEAGLHEMLGNVWEWTGESLDANGDATFRGAAWTTGAFQRYLPGLRVRWSPDLRRNDIGFRVVRTKSTPAE